MRSGTLRWRPSFVPPSSAKSSVRGVTADGNGYRGASHQETGCALDCMAWIPEEELGTLWAPRNTASPGLWCSTPLGRVPHRPMASARARGCASHRCSAPTQFRGESCSSSALLPVVGPPGENLLIRDGGLSMQSQFVIPCTARRTWRSAILALLRLTCGVPPCLALDPLGFAWAAVMPRASAVTRERNACVRGACIVSSDTGGLWPR